MHLPLLPRVKSSLPAGLIIAALLVLSSASTVQAATFVGGTSVWTIVGSPEPSTGACPGTCELLSYSNHLSVSVSGIIFMVLRNNDSQMVSLSSASATIATGAIVPALLIAVGLSPGTYNATFFAVAYSGVAISLSSSVMVTVA
jgi:hypothetical protein